MCDNYHSFYYNFTTYRCVCGVVYRRYCDACCDEYVIGVKLCDECDIENIEKLYLISEYFKLKLNRFLIHYKKIEKKCINILT